MAVDLTKAYELAKDFGIPLATFFLGMLAENRRQKRDVERQEANRRDDLRRADNDARDVRITRVLDVYVKAANAVADANEHGALTAGVLDLTDWTEYRDFCDRAARMAARGCEPIPESRRVRIRDQQLPVYFQRWKAALANSSQLPDVDKLIANLPK